MVLVIAAEPLLAAGVAATLHASGEHVTVATTLRDAIAVRTRAVPRAVVLALEPPLRDASPEAMCERIVAVSPTLVLFREGQGELLRRAGRAGARALLHTSLAGVELCDAVRRAMAGETVVDPRFLPLLLAGTDTARDARTAHLTSRELLVLRMVAQGHTSKEIASSVQTTVTAVDHSIDRALRRLGAANRPHGVAMAMRLGVLADST